MIRVVMEVMDQLDTVTAIHERLEGGDARVRELAEMLNLPVETVHMRLKIMAAEGSIVYCPTTHRECGVGGGVVVQSMDR